VLLARPALAQTGLRYVGGPNILLRVEKVQKDLGIDKEKAEKIEAALTKVPDDLKDEFAKVGRGSNASNEEKAAARKKITEANEKVIKDILSEKQQKRLQQISRQLAGTDMFSREDVQKTLKLTDKQKDQTKEINEDLQKQRRAFVSGLRRGGDFSAIMTKMQALNKEAMSSAIKVLTDDQKKEVKELTGAPLELKPEDFIPGGKPGGGKPRNF
jgi:hypothetical protein